MISQPKIDWHEIWRRTMEKCSGIAYDKKGHLKEWERSQAIAYLDHSSKEYPKKFQELIQIRSEDNVLDIGCGPGVLALPFSLISNSVTVVDISKNMLGVLRDNAGAMNITNIKSINKYWIDTCLDEDISNKYNVVICSNSIDLLGAQKKLVNCKCRITWNLVEALRKINKVGKRVYISFPFFFE